MAVEGLHLIVRGRVQGVFFRAFVVREAEALGLNGFTRNLSDGASVEVYAEGERDKLDRLLEKCRAGPPGARVDRVTEEWTEKTRGLKSFEVRY